MKRKNYQGVIQISSVNSETPPHLKQKGGGGHAKIERQLNNSSTGMLPMCPFFGLIDKLKTCQTYR